MLQPIASKRVNAATLRVLIAVAALAVAQAAFTQGTPATPQGTPATPTVAELAGAWSGIIEHGQSTTPFGLELVPQAEGKVLLRLTVPSMHLAGQPFGSVAPKVEGDRVTLGPFAFQYDGAARTLVGVVPDVLAPVYEIPLVLQRVDRIDAPARPTPTGTLVRPAWTTDLGSALWAGPRWENGVVYVGGDDGQVHAVDARTGGRRWSFRAGGAIRTRPSLAGGVVYVQADDGFLYKLNASNGDEVWRTRVVEKAIERLPFDHPNSRYDRFGSDVVVAGGRIHLGTHDGSVLALEPATGARLWSFATADAVLAAPAIESGRVYAGSSSQVGYPAGHPAGVMALDRATGRPDWRYEAEPGKSGAFGFPGSPAVGDGLVFVSGLDGRLYAFAE